MTLADPDTDTLTGYTALHHCPIRASKQARASRARVLSNSITLYNTIRNWELEARLTLNHIQSWAVGMDSLPTFNARLILYS